MTDPLRLVWLDLETTGLEPEDGQIREVGCIVTDRHLTELGRFHWLAGMPYDECVEGMDHQCVRLHTQSGLIGEIVQRYEQGICDCHYFSDTDLIEWIRSHRVDRQQTYLAGSSVHFDVRWLRWHTPNCLSELSYRLLDVSSFEIGKEMVTGVPRPKGNPAHRSLDDCLASIEMFRPFLSSLETTYGTH
jgi:oligoribonuclease